MKKFNILSAIALIIFSVFLISCKKKHNDPAPTTSTPPAQPVVVSSGFVSGSFKIGSTVYPTSISAQMTYKSNSHDFYILTASDDASGSYCEFWFSSKPTAGTYTVTSWLTGYLNGFGTNVGVAASAGNNSPIYYSQNYATATTLDVSLSGTDLVVTISGVSLKNSNAPGDTQIFGTTSTFP